MKVYGLSIENVGIEFSDRAEREKALVTFARGSTVGISGSGVKYTEGSKPFGTYERETKEVLVTCGECRGVFSIETAPSRIYPTYQSWDSKWSTSNGHICDACFVAAEQAKKVADAKETLKAPDDE